LTDAAGRRRAPVPRTAAAAASSEPASERASERFCRSHHALAAAADASRLT